ncbi:MAG TPA: lysophospholipid acyltransferase family protein [Opitutaceae bacterium]|jgi:1-acyl-sn-glycerol-3-phosphate acyltransferase|nr:lysophospholipid acyltransferase family protein [Opitutaceae bacterium]
MKRAWRLLAYLFSWALFAGGALALVVACVPASLWPAGPGRARAVRRTIRGLFRIWVCWLDRAGLVRIRWVGFDAGPLPRPAVYVANHPGLLDATFLLSRLPDPVCLVKPAVLRNPLLGLPARLAGYVSTEGGVDSVRGLADQLLAGNSVLIFPEGTRTRAGCALNALKPGFALIARRAHCPVEVLALRGEHDLFGPGQGPWPPPRFPSRWRIERAGAVASEAVADGAAASRCVEQLWLRRGEDIVWA